MNNVSHRPEYARVIQALKQELSDWRTYYQETQ